MVGLCSSHLFVMVTAVPSSRLRRVFCGRVCGWETPRDGTSTAPEHGAVARAMTKATIRR